MTLTLTLLPFIVLIAFVVAVSFIFVIKSDLSLQAKLVIPLMATFLILTHLFWIIDVVGRPIIGPPKNEFLYIGHRTVFVDDKTFTELWVKEKNISTSRLHIFQKDDLVSGRLERIRKEQKGNKKPKSHKFSNTDDPGRSNIIEITPIAEGKPNKPAVETTND